MNLCPNLEFERILSDVSVFKTKQKKDYTSYKNMPIFCNQTPHISTFICLNSFCLGGNLDVDWTNSLMTCVKKSQLK